MKIDNLASDMLKLYFEKLNNQEINYAVLRNYESLPEKNDSKDVDIVVSPKDLRKVVKFLIEIAKENNYQLIWKNELDYLEGFVFVKIKDGNVYSIKFDIFNGFMWRGCNYIDHNLILNNAIDYKSFKVPHKAHEAFIMIVYYVLYAKKIKQKYLELIYTNAVRNFKEFSAIVHLSFKQKVAKNIVELVRSNRIEELVSLRKKIKGEIIKTNFKSEPTLKHFIRHIKTEYFDRRKFGTMIAFSGPDGAGKSTLVNCLMDLFHNLGITSSVIPHHFLSKNIPSLHNLPVAPKKYAEQDYTKPYQAKPAGLVSSIIRTTYYYFAFLIDRFIYINKELRANQIVVFDRYYTDMITDPSRMRLSLKRIIVQKIFKTLPSPDYTFVVIADKDIILRRKDELSEDKLIELLREYIHLTNIIPNCQVLRNNGSIDEGKLMICKSVFDKFEARYS